jgi:hypothetical protein
MRSARRPVARRGSFDRTRFLGVTFEALVKTVGCHLKRPLQAGILAGRRCPPEGRRNKQLPRSISHAEFAVLHNLAAHRPNLQ